MPAQLSDTTLASAVRGVSAGARLGRRPGILTVDLEDYRRQELHRLLGGVPAANPGEVERQLELLLETFATLHMGATFFTVGRLTSELARSVWAQIREPHRVGCHGHDHLHVAKQGPRAFREDLRTAKVALEDTVAGAVISYRAPYFSSDGCDPWFAETLAEEGFALDSSRRIQNPPPGFSGTLALPGAAGAVTEVPFPCVGFGPKRLTVIGGTYLRLLPLGLIRCLLSRAERAGFVPLVYLHPYDLDPAAPPLEFPRGGCWRGRAGDFMRRAARDTVVDKLRALAELYEFRPIESMLAASNKA